MQKRCSFVLFCVLAVWRASATDYTVDPAESVFAVVTHKAGVAARLAHNHLVQPTTYTATAAISDGDVLKTTFSLSFNTADLAIDDPAAQKKWYPLVEKFGVLPEAFKELPESDRKTIAEHMFAADQLDAKTYPTITAKVLSVRTAAATQDKDPITHDVRIAMTVRDKTVERDCDARLSLDGERLVVDAHGKFTFAEFGIKPYSAFLGAVKNADNIVVIVHLEAKSVPPVAP